MSAPVEYPALQPQPFASDKVRVARPPDWIKPVEYDAAYKGNSPDAQVTQLLLSLQLHAENGEAFTHDALRLETMQAVQHLSQWRILFEPGTQDVAVHWLRIRRGEQVIENAVPERFRFLQREEGLERFVLEGRYTLLILLEDVRVGDILDYAFTIRSRPRLMPQNYFARFGLPPEGPVARYFYALNYAESRPLRWRASPPDFQPLESCFDELKSLIWSGDNYRGNKPEIATPAWHVGAPYVEVSDCPDWRQVAEATLEAWKFEPEEPFLGTLAGEIAAADGSPLGRCTRAVRLLQDDFRYLSVMLDLGGHVPAPPAVVARRRYGDCKDLAFLLVHLLRRLDIPCRPILVNARFGKLVHQLLPSPAAFDHVVVEYEVNGQRRWVDVTRKYQGGDALNFFIANFGFGLPVDSSVTSLVEQPTTASVGLYELKETIFVDTSGAPSLIGICLSAQGEPAENLRHDFKTRSLEVIQKERLELYSKRFVRARRTAPLQYRDNRDANEFMLAEAYEIEGFLLPGGPGHCRFAIHDNLLFHVLLSPAEGPRRAPFALPHANRFVHIIDLDAPMLRQPRVRGGTLSGPFVQFQREVRSQDRFWGLTVTLETLTDVVPPEQIQQYRKDLDYISNRCSWTLTMPVGYRRLARRPGIGELPPASAPRPMIPRRQDVPRIPSPQLTQPAQPGTSGDTGPDQSPHVAAPSSSHSHRRRRHRSHRWRMRDHPVVVVVFLFSILCLGLIVLALIARRK